MYKFVITMLSSDFLLFSSVTVFIEMDINSFKTAYMWIFVWN